MSYPTKFDEITEKLNRLKNGGGVTRPLVPAEGAGGAAFMAQAKKYDELLELIAELKTEFNLFRRETALTLKEIKQEARSLSALTGKTAGNDLKGGDGDDSYNDILDELSALKEHIKSALDFDKG